MSDESEPVGFAENEKPHQKLRPEAAATTPPGGWFRFSLTAYGPPALSWIGFGAVTPLFTLSAMALGASQSLAAFIAGLSAMATMLFDFPASWVATKLGEKWAMSAACLWDAIWLSVAFIAPNLVVFGLAVFCFGMSAAIFGLARHSYLIEATSEHIRGRIFSTLGGVERLGYLVGPVSAAAIIAVWNLAAAYAFAAALTLLAALGALALPNLPSEIRKNTAEPPATVEQPKLWLVLRQNLRVFLNVGTAPTILTLTRNARRIILPLWCSSLGMGDSLTSLVFAASMGVELALVFAGGSIMDRFGRQYVAVPCLLIIGAGMLTLTFARDLTPVIIVAIVFGIGDGISVGINMTLGADVAPKVGRKQFLSGWRFMSDFGGTVGPILISGLTFLGGLATAVAVLGVGAGLGAIWVNRAVKWSRTYISGQPQR